MLTQSKIETKKNIKRKKIVEVASALFSRKSYHEVMMDDVAKQASIAKGTVYNYFSSKEELYFSIMQQRMEKLITSLREKIKDESSSIESLHSFIVHLYMFMMKYQDFFMMYQKESLKAEHELCGELVALEKELKDMLAGIVIAGQSESLFRNIEKEFAVDLILGSIYGAVYRGIEKEYGNDKMSEDREKIYDFVLHGLFSGYAKNDLLPLRGKKIIITRTVEQSKESSEVFKQLGAEVIIFPTLDIVPPDSWQEFDEAVTGKTKLDFIIFTSAHSVKMFKERLEELKISLDFQKLKVVAVGNKTAAVCENYGINVNIIPKRFSAAGVVEELSNFELLGKTIFIPRSAIGREDLPEGLQQLGAIIKAVPVYNVSIPSYEKIASNVEILNNGKPDVYIFTSPSTFENFLVIMNIKDPVQYFLNLNVAAIGPTTKSAIENKNVHVDIMPEEYTIDGLANAIIGYYK